MENVEAYGLGRRIVPDFRDGYHLMSATLNPQEELPDEKEWNLGPILDQGAYPMCVAYATKQFLQSDPSDEPNPPDVFDLYNASQLVDNIPMPHDGTTVRAALSVIASRSIIDSAYVWAYDTGTLKNFLLTRGPVIFGVTWYKNMYYPDNNGLVAVGGDKVGGHSFLCCGYSQRTDLMHFCNSWGANWGANGTFYLPTSDVALLLKDFGEAGSAVDRHLFNPTKTF